MLGGAGEVDHRVGGSGGHGVARGGGGERGGRRAGHGGMLRARLVNEVGNMGSICLKVIWKKSEKIIIHKVKKNYCSK